jgi:hypothetical protein
MSKEYFSLIDGLTSDGKRRILSFLNGLLEKTETP